MSFESGTAGYFWFIIVVGFDSTTFCSILIVFVWSVFGDLDFPIDFLLFWIPFNAEPVTAILEPTIPVLSPLVRTGESIFASKLGIDVSSWLLISLTCPREPFTTSFNPASRWLNLVYICFKSLYSLSLRLSCCYVPLLFSFICWFSFRYYSKVKFMCFYRLWSCCCCSANSATAQSGTVPFLSTSDARARVLFWTSWEWMSWLSESHNWHISSCAAFRAAHFLSNPATLKIPFLGNELCSVLMPRSAEISWMWFWC